MGQSKIEFKILLCRNEETRLAKCFVIGFPEIEIDSLIFKGQTEDKFLPYSVLSKFKAQLSEIVKHKFDYVTDEYLRGRVRQSKVSEVDPMFLNGYETLLDRIKVAR